jgi:DNA gyrase subunit A
MVMEMGVVTPINIEEEIKSSYLDYAMSVIVSRALPDVRDGLKPVQRRVLYAMNELGLQFNTPHKKSARIVGEVLGKYHPHGDASVYETMVRMAQDFSLRYVLVDGQGNFGSIDNDPAAAMRYTEARLSQISREMLVDIDKETVDFAPNFDDSLKEPLTLPARLPNLLVNGASGIAVGMATNIPPHNLREVCDAIAYLIDNPQATVSELMQFVKGPDFPTGGIIMGTEGIETAYATGQGKVIVKAKATEEISKGGRRQIIITELPYQVNKASLVERIATLSREKKIAGISEVRDESDREGMRIVIELKREAEVQQVFNNLYKNTPMQTAFFINMVALVDGQPKLLGLKEALTCYVEFRCKVIERRSRFDLEKARNRAHVLEGFTIALDNLDQVINIIRHSENVDVARNNLMEVFQFTVVQAQAVLDIPLRRLTHLERQQIINEYADVIKNIAYLEDLLNNPPKILHLVSQDVEEIKSKYGDLRRTSINEEEATEFSHEDLIPHENMLISLTEQGFIKRIPLDTYRLQHRGGKGVIGMTTLKSDKVKHILIADTHDEILFFTGEGKVYSLKCYEIPVKSSRGGKGLALVNILPISLKDKITSLVVVASLKRKESMNSEGEASSEGLFLLLATRNGLVKKTPMAKFASVRRNGIMAMSLRADDSVVSVRIASNADEIMLVTQNGYAIKFNVGKLRSASRTSGGVRGIRISDDHVVGMDVVPADSSVDEAKQHQLPLEVGGRNKDDNLSTYHLLAVTDRGFGKLTPVRRYPVHNRGGKGLRMYRISDKTGKVVASKVVRHHGFLMLLSAKGNIVGIPMDQVPAQRRSSRGVHLMAVGESDEVISIATFDS